MLHILANLFCRRRFMNVFLWFLSSPLAGKRVIAVTFFVRRMCVCASVRASVRPDLSGP